jgi:serine/threonine protein kinase
MSPEQALGNDAHTPSDVFSLAAVLTYAATTTPPFGHTANAVAMLLRITDDEPDISGVPETLRPVLAECLAKDPAARPTAQQLVERLAPLVPEDAQRPLATKVWPDAGCRRSCNPRSTSRRSRSSPGRGRSTLHRRTRTARTRRTPSLHRRRADGAPG